MRGSFPAAVWGERGMQQLDGWSGGKGLRGWGESSRGIGGSQADLGHGQGDHRNGEDRENGHHKDDRGRCSKPFFTGGEEEDVPRYAGTLMGVVVLVGMSVAY